MHGFLLLAASTYGSDVITAHKRLPTSSWSLVPSILSFIKNSEHFFVQSLSRCGFVDREWNRAPQPVPRKSSIAPWYQLMDPSQREVRTMLYFSYFHHSFRTGSGTLSSARAPRDRETESVNAKRANLVDARSPALLLCCVSHLILGDDRRRVVLGAAMAGLTLLPHARPRTLEACLCFG